MKSNGSKIMKYIGILFLPSIAYIVIILILSFAVNPVFHWFWLFTPGVFLISLITTVIKFIWDKKGNSSLESTTIDANKDASSKKWRNTILTLFIILCAFLYLFPYTHYYFVNQYQYYVEQEIPLRQVGTFHIENCEDLPKHTNQYTGCKMIQYKNEQIYTSTPLDCSNMNNDESGCKNLQVIQKAILDKEKDVNICVPMDGRKEFPICIAQFTGTDVWKNGCEKFLSEEAEWGGYSEWMVPYLYGKCLTKTNANITFPRQILGSFSVDQRKVKGHSSKILTPLWFTSNGTIPSERMFTYLESIDTNPNNTDELGRTAVILYIDYIRSIDTYMEKLPEKQRRQVLEEQLQPLKRLVKFGVDPNIKDLNGYNALDYAKFIKNPELLSHTLEILK